MTTIKINAITVPADSGDELAKRFAARAGAVDGQDGFEGFELLAPTDGRDVWLVLTRWRDEAAFEAWMASASFGHSHAGTSGSGSDRPGSGDEGSGSAQPPVSTQAELWSYRVAGGSDRTG